MTVIGSMLSLFSKLSIALLPSLVLYSLFQCIYKVFFHPLRHIPGPFFAKFTRLWLFYHDFGGNPHKHIRELHQRLGPLVRISPNEVSINDVRANKWLYSQSSPWVKPAYHYKAFQSSPAYSIFTELDPSTHASHLRLLAPAFSQARLSTKEAQALLWEKCKAMVRGIEQKENEGAVAISLTGVFRSFALDVVTMWTFGRCANSLGTFHSDLFEVFDSAAESVIFFQHIPFLRMLIPYIAPLVPKLVPNKLLGLYAKQALDQVKAEKNHPCVLSVLASPSWRENRGYSLSDGQIISDGIVILAAGADTTAAALSVGIHHLARLPHLWARLQNEIRPVMETLDGNPYIELLAQLPFLNAVIKEGLRVSCPIRGHMPRVVPAGGWDYGKTHFPAGSVIATSAFYGCNNEEVFPDPERYDPLRWVQEDTVEMDAHLQPFSRGTRQCIGQNLTLAMQRIAIANVVHHFHPITVDNTIINTREYVTLLIDSPLELLAISVSAPPIRAEIWGMILAFGTIIA
ncbi:cytochrome P450 4A10 [Colletotrichum cereale]|nr:cytochrome P450 4A10 [Colletotrichum cereale]